MVDYRRAVMESITFQTKQGVLYPQDLWSLSIEYLRDLVVAFYKEIKEDNSDTQLLLDLNDVLNISKKSKEQEIKELKFEILKDVFTTKANEIKAVKEAKQRRKEIEKLTAILHQKQNEELNNKSPEELEAMIRELQG